MPNIEDHNKTKLDRSQREIKTVYFEMYVVKSICWIRSTLSSLDLRNAGRLIRLAWYTALLVALTPLCKIVDVLSSLDSSWRTIASGSDKMLNCP